MMRLLMISKKLSYEFVSRIVHFTTFGSIGVWSPPNVRGTLLKTVIRCMKSYLMRPSHEMLLSHKQYVSLTCV
jgi:hypothetical protein